MCIELTVKQNLHFVYQLGCHLSLYTKLFKYTTNVTCKLATLFQKTDKTNNTNHIGRKPHKKEKPQTSEDKQ